MMNHLLFSGFCTIFWCTNRCSMILGVKINWWRPDGQTYFVWSYKYNPDHDGQKFFQFFILLWVDLFFQFLSWYFVITWVILLTLATDLLSYQMQFGSDGDYGMLSFFFLVQWRNIWVDSFNVSLLKWLVWSLAGGSSSIPFTMTSYILFSTPFSTILRQHITFVQVKVLKYAGTILLKFQILFIHYSFLSSFIVD